MDGVNPTGYLWGVLFEKVDKVSDVLEEKGLWIFTIPIYSLFLALFFAWFFFIWTWWVFIETSFVYFFMPEWKKKYWAQRC